MAILFGNTFQKRDFLSYVADPHQVAGAIISTLSEGKADGVRIVNVRTGTGLEFSVLPGRGMDIAECSYSGKPLHFFSGTGITSPSYYEKNGQRWLRSFYGGLLTTCGVTNSGQPSVDEGIEFGLHGRVANAAAENLCISQDWKADEFVISVRGTIREAQTMAENITLTRKIATMMGSNRFQIEDNIENRGFDRQPLMMLYHFNFGFPILNKGAGLAAAIISTEPRDDEARANDGIAKFFQFSEPQNPINEQVYFHKVASNSDGTATVMLFNKDIGDGTSLGFAIRYSVDELPELTEWKMMKSGCYALGIEPGTVNPIGRKLLRERGKLPFIEAQDSYHVTIDCQVIVTRDEIESVESEIKDLA